MIKKIVFFVFFISSLAHAQHTVKGVMSPKIESDWLILYKIEGTKQVFINNTNIKPDSIEINGDTQAVSSFQIKLPASAKPGVYRATYKLEGAGFVDFFYNKENVSFIFNPAYPQQSVVFTTSAENKLHNSYTDAISAAQEKLDSIQVAVLQDTSLELHEEYKVAYKQVKTIQNSFEKKSTNKYIAPFVRASARSNPPEILTSINGYIANIKNTFFNNLDFSNTALINSSFLTNRILDYIFYINYSDDLDTQQNLYKESITTVLSKIKNPKYKRDVIEFLIEQFEAGKNLDIIDYLFEEHYYKLPKTLQNAKFKNDKMALFAAEVGRIAPDFSWTENGKSLKLSTLNDAENYVLVFWSTSCSHCLREIPELYTYSKTKNNVKVIAFALEQDSFVWENYKKTNLSGWHNVLGLDKWQHETAKIYQVFSTPTYFILDKNKKIIAKPNDINDVEEFLENL